MNKKIKLISLAAAFILSTSLFQGCNTKKNASPTINVFNWGEYIDEEILKDFTAKTGIKVNYETYATNEEMYEKIKAGTTNYDLICPSDYMLERMINEGLVQKIDYSKLSNYKNIDDSYKNLSYDPQNEYSIPYMWGTIGIIYDKTKISDSIDSWNTLWNPKYKDDIFMSDDMRNSIGISLKRLGYSLNSTNPEEIKKATEELIKQRNEVNPVYIGDQVKDSLRSGEKSIAVIYSGDAAVLKQEKPDRFEYVIPKEGTNLWFDVWAIPKNAKHVEETLKFLDYLLDENVNKKNVEYIGYATPNKATLSLLDEKIRNDKSIYPPKEILNKSEVFIDLKDARELYNDAWLEVTSK
ncbi:spermidine/putrescine transport system substrate-binding protein [Clostridium sp. USBA 49]|jgi:spermidine/putrescine transport system substrate-binding protein|uniref:ABC transporter substrate-binding protein n=1 Tax=Clostridium TaxID=1485 RepID=UPI00099A11B6|nr:MULTISPECIES: spermidine/putrescine ABC transporter substrate-binding protein [Clostridium]SKA78036.1 spermidine/putrescine transport system substrate-binding protein [Clostridium sp. USBA 49]